MSNAETYRGSRYRWVIGGSVLLLQFAMGLNFLAVAPLYPLIIDEYGLSRAAASLLVGATSLGVAVVLVPSSLIVSRLGGRLTLALGGLLMSAMALAPFAANFPVLLAARVSFALGAAVILSGTPVVLMRWFPPRELALVSGINVVGQSTGVMISMLTAARIADSLGWQGALFAFGGVSIIGTVLWSSAARGGEAIQPTAGFSLRTFIGALGDRGTLLLAMGAAAGTGTTISFASWLPTYYNEEFGFSLERAGLVASLLAFFGIIGSALGSALATRFPHRRPFLMAAGIGMPITAIGCFVTENPLILYSSLAVFGIMCWVYQPTLFTVPMELPGITVDRVAIAVAVVLGSANLSGFLLPLLVGFLRDQTGSYTLGLTMAALLAIVVTVSGYLIPETGPIGRRDNKGELAPEGGLSERTSP